MKWESSNEVPSKTGEYVCKTNKGRYVIGEKKEGTKFLTVKNPHYLRSNEKIALWLNEVTQ